MKKVLILILVFMVTCSVSFAQKYSNGYPIAESNYNLQSSGFEVINFKENKEYLELLSIKDYYLVGLDKVFPAYVLDTTGNVHVDSTSEMFYDVVVYDGDKQKFYFPFRDLRTTKDKIKDTVFTDVVPRSKSVFTGAYIYLNKYDFNKKGELYIEVHLEGRIINTYFVKKKWF